MEKYQVEIKASYRGFQIKFSEWDKKWELQVDEETAYFNEDLNKVKQYADKLLKSNFKPIKAFYGSWRDENYIEVTVTSIDDEGNAWIKKENGRREKTDKKDLKSFTDENRIIISKIVKNREIIDKTNILIEKLRKSMKKAL